MFRGACDQSLCTRREVIWHVDVVLRLTATTRPTNYWTPYENKSLPPRCRALQRSDYQGYVLDRVEGKTRQQVQVFPTSD